MGDEVLDCMSDGSCGDETPGKPLFGLKVCPGTKSILGALPFFVESASWVTVDYMLLSSYRFKLISLRLFLYNNGWVPLYLHRF